MGLYRLLLCLSLSFKTGSWELSNILDESTSSTFINPSTSISLSLSLAASSPHPSAPPSLALSPALSLYNLSLPDCSIISPLWMADGRARWVYRGRARAVVGVKYVEILFLLNAPSPLFFCFFAAVCVSESCCLKIPERWHDLWSRSLPGHHMDAFELHTWLSLRDTESLSLQPLVLP